MDRSLQIGNRREATVRNRSTVQAFNSSTSEHSKKRFESFQSFQSFQEVDDRSVGGIPFSAEGVGLANVSSDLNLLLSRQVNTYYEGCVYDNSCRADSLTFI